MFMGFWKGLLAYKTYVSGHAVVYVDEEDYKES